MPVERGPQINLRSAVVVGLAGVVLAAGMFGLITWLASSGGVEVQLGDDVFEAGDTERIAAEIADRGPILYSDVAGGSRDIYLVHLGGEPDEGWYAFAAQQPGADRECFLRWDAEEELFVDECDGAQFPPTGEGLPSYDVFLDDDDSRVVVDINGVRSTTTVPPTADPDVTITGDR